MTCESAAGLEHREGERTGGLPVSQLLGLSTGEADAGLSSGDECVRIAGIDVRTSAATVNQLPRMSSLESERSGDLESTAILWIGLDGG